MSIFRPFSIFQKGCLLALGVAACSSMEVKAKPKVPPRPKEMTAVSASALRPFMREEKWGYRDSKRNIVIRPQFLSAEAFSPEGIAAVIDNQGWAFINVQGKILLRPFIVDNGPDYFSEGLARFSDRSKIGFFDKYGRIRIRARFTYAKPFSEERAAVCRGCKKVRDGEHWSMQGGKWGYIDHTGRIVIPLKFENAQKFENGKAHVRQKGKDLVIDKSGDLLAPAPPHPRRAIAQQFPGQKDGPTTALSQKKSDRVSIQRPENPAALGKLMTQMKTKADAIISELSKGIQKSTDLTVREALFLQGALGIYRAMRPVFGPANAWLFQERQSKINLLAQALRIKSEKMRKAVDEPLFENAVNQLEALLHLGRSLGFKVRVQITNRSAILWSPAPGFSVQMIDPSRKVDWTPPYAGTMAGSPVKHHLVAPKVTLYVFPPYPGVAHQHLIRREQPGAPVFFTGSLIAFTLQEAQSHDVAPSPILKKILQKLPSFGLSYTVSERLKATLHKKVEKNIKTMREKNGVIYIKLKKAPPPSTIKCSCAVVFSFTSGEHVVHNLRF